MQKEESKMPRPTSPRKIPAKDKMRCGPRPKTNASPVPTESQEQQALFHWARLQEGAFPELGLLVHVPNGGLRNMPEAVRFKAEGVRKGFPDLLLPVARGGYHSLAIELKRRKHGKISPEQKRWIDSLNEQGYLASVCYGWEDASRMLMEYLRLDG
jgi:hypothetical protein